jgi:hypothetical protein
VLNELHERDIIPIRPTRKTTDLLRGIDAYTIDHVAENTPRPARLYASSSLRDRCRRELRRSTWRRETRDFIHKLKVVFKELNETTIWLELIGESSLLSPEKNSRDYRKPRIVSNYRSINPDCEKIAGLAVKSGQLVVWSSRFDIRHGTFDM